MSFRHTSILIAVDDSDCAERALDYGLNLAEQLKLPVRIIHAVQSPGNTGGDFRRIDLKAVHEAAGDAPEFILGAAILDRALEYAGQRPLDIEAVLLGGDPASALLRFAADCDRPILVVGRRGRGRLQQLLLGSVSDKTVRLAQCPVIVIH